MHTRFANTEKTHSNNFIFCLIKIALIFLSVCVTFAFLFSMTNFGSESVAVAENQSSGQEISEEDLKDATEDVLNEIDFSALDEVVNRLDGSLFDGKTFKQYVSDVVSGKENFDISTFFSFLKTVLRSNLKSIFAPLSIVLCVSLLCVLFKNLHSSKIKGVEEIIYLVCFSVIVIIVSAIISNLIVDAKDSILNMQKSMNAIFPILLTLMTAIGGVVSVKAYTPLVLVLSNIVSNVFVYVLFPLFSLSLVLSIVGHISSNTKLDKFNSFLKSLFKWIVGVVCSVFVGYLTLKGFTAGVSDGISLKATKFAIKNYVPLLGGYISEGFELVKAGSLIVKNAIGFVGVLIVAVLCLLPIISVAICELSLKLLAGILEPVGATKTSSLLSSISESLKMLVALVVGVAVLYFLTIYLLTCTVANLV